MSEINDTVSTDVAEAENAEINESERKENQLAFNEAFGLLKSYNLKWTIRSIDYILDTFDTSLNQLRACVFKKKDEDGYLYNPIKATMILVQAGLIGSKFKHESAAELEDKAYDIIEDFQEKFGSHVILHILIIKEMEEKHFFTGAREGKVMIHIAEQGKQLDVLNTIAQQRISW